MRSVKFSQLGKIFSLAVFLMVLFASGQQAKSEVPNGDGDLLWERGLSGRSVNDAVFHPINGNIIAAVNHEIWEIDPKDGHTIRIFEGGTASGEYDQFDGIKITSDGKTVVTDGGSGVDGLIIWDYETGKVKKIFDKGGPNRGSLGVFPDNKRAIFFTFKLEDSADRQIVIYNFETDDIEKSVSISPYGIDKLTLSKDGKYLTIGKTFNNNGDWTFTMELWDAETLTKIRDFGEATNIHEFRDVQISNDGQFVGFLCSGPRLLYLFNNNNSQLIKKFDNTSAFSFTPNTKIIIYSGTNPEDAQSNIISLPTLDTVYQYIWARSLFRFNENNEMYSGGSSLKLYSNHWYEVGVTAPAGISLKIIQISYTRNLLRISTEGIDIINGLIITDTLGKRIYQQNNITITNNTAEIPIILPSGNYLLKIVSNGKELTSKFIVME